MDGQKLDRARAAILSLQHRGPDGSGEWRSPHAFMAHRRLKIIDLSEQASQPFVSQDGRHVLTFNGEIFNYIELREELELLGERFRTSSDTEVLLTMLRRYGTAAFSRLEGMFAGALHDTHTGEHLLFRDPLGQKPLYWHLGSDGSLVYGSELGSLVGVLEDATLDRESFVSYLMHSYYLLQSTPLVGVRKLLPGHYLRWTQGRVELSQYFLSRPGDDPVGLGPEEAVDEAQRIIEHSCRVSLRADVSYGVFLSGGVDSTVILDACRRFAPDVAAFSVRSEEPDFDESPNALAVAQHLGVKNHRIYSLTEQALGECFEEYLTTMDEPHGDPGYVNALFLSKTCRGEITVALAGDGGDEVFAGYLPFRGLAGDRFLGSLPASLLHLLHWSAKTFVPSSDAYLGLQFKALCYLQGFPAPRRTRFPLWLATTPPEGLLRLCPWKRREYFSRNGDTGTVFAYAADLFDELPGRSLQQRLLYYYQKVFLPEFVCLHTDRAAMRHSLEVRSPLINPSVVRFANGLADNVRMHKGQPKWVLRRILQRQGFPKSIWGQGKRGFTFPIARWFKSTLRPLLEALPADPALEGLVDRQELGRLVRGHLSGRHNAYRILLNLLAFCAWRKNFPEVKVGE
ncbi:MAG: asparagine synthase (glutamine-hydrolyzing) [Proteobacteria bacterium]|nr:asparagine synthase (glutamine-hydrolyzing) [Pseudomonadota bacterium]MBU1593912.1 asparagine synthase (glutamine-hydrolyzing) [Pseudomonadota bacterium]